MTEHEIKKAAIRTAVRELNQLVTMFYTPENAVRACQSARLHAGYAVTGQGVEIFYATLRLTLEALWNDDEN